MTDIDKDVFSLVLKLSNNYTQIIHRETLRKYPKLDWGDNGIGDRWAHKKFNYTVIKNKNISTYSENDENKFIENNFIVNKFRSENNGKGIIGIFVHSIRINIPQRPIRDDIKKTIVQLCCVSCGSSSEIVCDHKNDLYNNERVLNKKTQKLQDFQPLCNHCNLQKRQIAKNEIKNEILYSAKNLAKYKVYRFEFPWEKKVFDKNESSTKEDTYWYDPVEFNNKVFCYMMYTLPLLFEIKKKLKESLLNKC